MAGYEGGPMAELAARLHVRRAVVLRAPDAGGADHIYHVLWELTRARSPGEGAGVRGRVLVACVGNIFLGDDGFGVEVAGGWPACRCPRASVSDYGTGGMHLAYDLAEG